MKTTLAIFCFLTASICFGQNVGIGTTTPNPKAALDITASGKGLLIPRMDSATRVAITSPPDGLMVFQTDQRKGFWYAINNTWLYIPDKATASDNLGNHTASDTLIMNDNEVFFRATADSNHGVGWYGVSNSSKNWAGQNIDGPVLYGYLGGALGTKFGGRKSALNWNNQNRVGINNPNPQRTLDVAGIARAASFEFTTPQTRYVNIAADAFSPVSSTYNRSILGGPAGAGYIVGAIFLQGGVAGSAGYVSAPVLLPAGTVITKIEAKVLDNDGTSLSPQITFAGLNYSTPSNASAVALDVAATSANSPDLQTITLNLNHEIANDFSYKIIVRLNQNNSETRLYNVRITYTVSQL